MISVQCANCGVQLSVKDEAAGKKGKCPKCGSAVQIPDLKVSVVAEVSSPGDARDTCWYCQHFQAEEGSSVKVDLHHEAKWQGTSVTVPRCRTCEAAHWTSEKTFLFAIVLGVVATVPVGLVAGGCGLALLYVALLWIVTLVGGKILGRRRARAKAAAAGITYRPEGARDEYPPIRELLTAGWSPGELSKDGHPENCPVCGAYTGKSGMRHVMDSAASFNEKCVVCGGWGCRRCMHYHSGNRVIWGGIFESEPGLLTEYREIPWRHDKCCDCGHKGEGTLTREAAGGT